MKRIITSVVVSLVIIVLLILITRTFIVTPFTVGGASMSPAYNNGEHLWINKLDKDYKKDDVIVFRRQNTNEYYLRRIVGIEGDNIKDNGGKLEINSKIFNVLTASSSSALNIKLGSGQYFVIADNVNFGLASPASGLINQDQIVGKVYAQLKDKSKESNQQQSSISEEDKELLMRGVNDPYVKHVRVAIDNYNQGVNQGYSGIEFSGYKEYLKGKFILMYLNNEAVMGGKDMLVVFPDKPDKLFYIWVYRKDEGTFDLRAFEPDDRFDENQARSAYESSKDIIEKLSLFI